MPLTEEQEDRAIDALAEGLGVEDIAVWLGCRADVVRAFVLRLSGGKSTGAMSDVPSSALTVEQAAILHLLRRLAGTGRSRRRSGPRRGGQPPFAAERGELLQGERAAVRWNAWRSRLRMSRIAPELEAIADTCLSANVPEPIGVRLQFLPELPDQDAQVLDVDGPAPDLADQKLVGEDLASVLYQDTEHIEFARRQVDRRLAEPDAPVDEADRETSGAEHRLFAVFL